MKRTMISITATALVLSAASVSAFAPDTRITIRRHTFHAPLYSSVSLHPHNGDQNEEPLPFYATQKDSDRTVDGVAPAPLQAQVAAAQTTEPTQVARKSAPKKAAAAQPHGKQGVLSPLVLLAKHTLGSDRLNKLRAKMIALHSDVIAAAVDTSDTPLGQTLLKTLFEASDTNRNGLLEEEELARVFRLLGFDWLREKQIQGILKRADVDQNGAIDLNEFLLEAPKTLRTNLIKLAKKNGGDLGLLV